MTNLVDTAFVGEDAVLLEMHPVDRAKRFSQALNTPPDYSIIEGVRALLSIDEAALAVFTPEKIENDLALSGYDLLHEMGCYFYVRRWRFAFFDDEGEDDEEPLTTTRMQ